MRAATSPGTAEPLQLGPNPRHDSVFVRLTATALFPVAARTGKLGLDVRYRDERWTGGVADRRSLAGFATASVPVSASMWALLGAGYGKDDRWTWGDATRSGTVPLTGYQLEAGVLGEVAPELSLAFLVTHESRKIGNPAGGAQGGFFGDQGPGAPGSRTLLHRFGLQLTYRLDHHA